MELGAEPSWVIPLDKVRIVYPVERMISAVLDSGENANNPLTRAASRVFSFAHGSHNQVSVTSSRGKP